MLTQQRVKLANGIELDVVDEGPPDAPVLIFLHGFPESHRTWRNQIAHFSDRFRCIAPDQRGYRGSSKPQEVEAYTPDKLIGDVFLLADALGVEKFTIVGHDWGGAIAWGVAYMGMMNGRVPRAVIANAPHPVLFPKLLFTNRQQREASQYFRDFRDPANDPMIGEHGLAPLLMKVFEGKVMTKIDEDEAAAMLQDWSDPDAAFGMLNYYRASPMEVLPLDAPYEIPADYTQVPLPRLAIPTLVIWAMADEALPPENLDGLEDVIEQLDLFTVPECGHFVQWEAPGAFNSALEDFLDKTA
ncbi:alpha/beta hydrolase [Altererythrobacter arenosus]|uniref:Alpha/beta hydrolase n=1 Tax=Altererythrobacter arenosus TaxID=3032592 RepID=A0ABY8G022_9SPHN|nr:alpha/beta hydrolase [Altererythrobacter sp. CAU 1644]WFL78991.1 alpha/beta hydrolase [Altererythrobacter sp. CAU 1644]